MMKVGVELAQLEKDDIRLLTVKDIQEMFQIKKDLAYKLVNTKGFPKIKIGREIRVPKQALKEWIKSYTNSYFNI